MVSPLDGFTPTSRRRVSHYYGDAVRRLFVTAGGIMLVTTPFLQDRLPISGYAAIWVVIILDVIAGLANPRMPWLAYLETVIALLCCAVFEYYAISDFDSGDYFFWTNQILAFIFFVALYYAVKTARSGLLREQKEEDSAAS